MSGVLVMSVAHTKLFKSNRSQAVRLPKSVSFPESIKDVDILVVGNARIILPSGESWDNWFDRKGVTADFMVERAQPEDQLRDDL
jgi:antitoxin VapB